MSIPNCNLHLSNRIAELTQLQAEERWIMDALSKIKNQRNCIQIERLQLENMRNKLLKRSTTKDLVEASKSIEPKKAATTFSIGMAAPKPHGETSGLELSTPNRKLLEVEEKCNSETLELHVENSMLNMNPQEYNIEEYDEEDEEIGDNLLLDMNIFMNCVQHPQ